MGRAAPANACEFIHQMTFLQNERLLLADLRLSLNDPLPSMATDMSTTALRRSTKLQF